LIAPQTWIGERRATSDEDRRRTAEQIGGNSPSGIGGNRGRQRPTRIREAAPLRRHRERGTRLSTREFEFYARAHVDFVVTTETSKPIMIVEYDGPFHAESRQVERDKIKDALCVDAGLGILRINANHVTRLYRGISILRWIIEVTELQKWFEQAQVEGQIPCDEPFDPAMIADDGRGRKWPYWLSVTANQSILSFLEKMDNRLPKGRVGILGSDAIGNQHSLSFIWFGNEIIWSRTAVRPQNVDFPSYDLLNEISICELGLKLRKFQNDELASISVSQFQRIHAEFCQKYNAHPSHSMGGYPFHCSWTPEKGFQF
jgi:very-short-patch-repair endonuclease